MLKYITYYILILSFFGSQLIKLSIYADFKINQKFISEVFCIDKDKPMSNCNGKCYLSKQYIFGRISNFLFLFNEQH